MGNLKLGEQFKVKNASSAGLSLRKEATTNTTTKDGKEKNLILSLPNGTKLTLESDKVETSDNHTWYSVKYTDKDKKELKGWVASNYLEELLPLPSLPPLSLPILSWSALYDNLPSYNEYPCDQKAFPNQCAIRMGITLEQALKGTGVSLDSFQGARCGNKAHNPRHILRAQELADWLTKQTKLVGKVQIIKKSDPWYDFEGRLGLVFFQNITGYDGIDHIDVLDGKGAKNQCSKLKGVPSIEWLEKCDQVWFWDLCPCTTKMDVYSEANANSTVLFTPKPGQRLEIGRVGYAGRGWGEVKMEGGKLGFREVTINVYSKPSANSTNLTNLGSFRVWPLEVVDVQEKWVQIKTGDEGNRIIGWVERRFVAGIPDQAVVA